jgi:anti-sigma-K factor RskA
MDERIEELFPLYALGALTDEERAQVEAYVGANAEAKARLDELTQTASLLAYDITPIEPPAELKKSLMDRVQADARIRAAGAGAAANRAASRAASHPRPQAPRLSLWNLLRSFSPIFAALSLLAAILLGAWALSLNAEVARLRNETVALRKALADQRAVIAQIAAPADQIVVVSGTNHQPDARGHLIAHNDGSAVLVVSGLDQLEAGRTYQLWMIAGDTPLSAGVFEVDEGGVAVVQVARDAAPGAFDAVGVSVEPEGGSPTPTGDIVMLGQT